MYFSRHFHVALASTFLFVFSSWGCGSSGGLPEGMYEEGPPLLDGEGKADGFGPEVPAYGIIPDDSDFDAPFQVMFAPEEPVVTMELHFIDWVREARLADERQFTEGQNPYRIDYAVYTLRNQRIMEDLADAHDDGVDVQILIESDQLGKDRDWMTVDEYLASRGFEVVPDHRDLDENSMISADLIGIHHSGLMHLKTRIFELPDDRVVLSGSFNVGSYAPLNDENFHIIREPELTAGYAACYQALLHDQRCQNEWSDERPVNVLFSRPQSGLRPGTRALEWLEEENEQILMMVYSLRDLTARDVDRSLSEILIDKAAAGVPVYVITDRLQSDGYNNDIEDVLRAGGVPTWEVRNTVTGYSAMHNKVAILGRTRIKVISDSANWTKGGMGDTSEIARNNESVLFIDSDKLDNDLTGRRYISEWLAVLRRYADQSVEIDAQPSFETIRDQLLAQPAWPDQEMNFTAYEAETNAQSESVFVLGDRGVLGNWGDDGDGLALQTTPEDYPTWVSSSAVEMPLGIEFEWKLAVEDTDTGSIDWEKGSNRKSRAAPTFLRPGLDLELTATWKK
jgi:phosphatidylserine/phosphatidylglycerophosphate/cardiolipin synthase-like enzyme